MKGFLFRLQTAGEHWRRAISQFLASGKRSQSPAWPNEPELRTHP
jgi:hypothetical protein